MMGMSRFLFLCLALPHDFAGGHDDPDALADHIADVLTDRERNQAVVRAMFRDGEAFDGAAAWRSVERVMVSAIPCPQWLTPETLDRLRRAAS